MWFEEYLTGIGWSWWCCEHRMVGVLVIWFDKERLVWVIRAVEWSVIIWWWCWFDRRYADLFSVYWRRCIICDKKKTKLWTPGVQLLTRLGLNLCLCSLCLLIAIFLLDMELSIIHDHSSRNWTYVFLCVL